MITTDHLDSLKTRGEKARRMDSQPRRSPVERERARGRRVQCLERWTWKTAFENTSLRSGPGKMPHAWMAQQIL
jgi:hypothetical protein